MTAETEDHLQNRIKALEKANDALQEKLHRFQDYFETSVEGVYRVRMDPPLPTDLPSEEQVEWVHKHAFVEDGNDVWAKMYGFNSVEEVKGKRIVELLNGDDQAAKEIIRTWVEGGHSFSLAGPFEIALNGRQFWINSNSSSQYEGGHLVCMWGSQIDITNRKAFEAETFKASRLASIGELAAGVAHEINNPINVIINYAQILLKENPKLDDADSIPRRIMKEAERVEHIVRNLLSFARESKAESSPCEMQSIIKDSLELFSKQFDKDGIQIRLDLPDHTPLVIANYQKIQQVIVNLLSNARHALNQKYSGFHENKILDIHVRRFTENTGDWVRTEVHDHGVGIPESQINSVFDPFFSTKPLNEGTGLGLSISYGIVNKLGGQIAIESEEGQYTKIVMQLPVAKEERFNGSNSGS